MHVSHHEGPYEATLHVGCDNERLHFDLAVTNHDDETLSTHSGMGAWNYISLTDDNDIPRLESMGSTAAVTYWELPPGQTMVTTRTTRTLDEIRDRVANDSTHINYVASVSEFLERRDEDNIFFAPHVSLPDDNDTEMTVTGRVSLDAISPTLDCTFTPAELPDPIDIGDEYDLAENARKEYGHMRVDSDVSAPSFTYSDTFESDKT